MPNRTVAEQAITDSLVADIQEKATREGFRSLLNGAPEFKGAVTGRVNFTADTDAEAIIYETATGEPRAIPAVYLRKTLRKRRADGSPAFVAGDPETGEPISAVREYRQGTMMCFLHPDHPDRDLLVEMGIGPEVVCGGGETTPAAHIANAFNLRMHEMKKHPLSYQIREEYLAREREDKARDEQRRYTEAILELAKTRGA